LPVELNVEDDQVRSKAEGKVDDGIVVPACPYLPSMSFKDGGNAVGKRGDVLDEEQFMDGIVLTLIKPITTGALLVRCV